MVTEDDVVDLFERAAQDLDPAVAVIVSQAEQLGRRLRFRRRAWIAAGSSLVVAVVTGAGVAGISLAGPLPPLDAARAAGSHATTGPAAWPASGGQHSPSLTRGLKPTQQPATGSATPPGGGMTRPQMLVTLRRLLPAGGTLSDLQADTSKGSIEVDYNDGQGAVDLMISVNSSAFYSKQVLSCPHPPWTDEGSRPAGALPISCTMRTLPGGSTERDAVMYADIRGFYGYDIYDQRPDGITVFIQVGNGINHGLPLVDRARPPGSMAQWRAIAENPAWHL